MRWATTDDIDYFIQAGKDFCQHTPFVFDAKSYTEVVRELLDDPDCIAIVDGNPTRCHCAAKLMPNFYNDNEIIAKVFTTWGRGGLKCFTEVERICRDRGVMFLMADSMIVPKIIKFYENIGMKMHDSVFMKRL